MIFPLTKNSHKNIYKDVIPTENKRLYSTKEYIFSLAENGDTGSSLEAVLSLPYGSFIEKSPANWQTNRFKNSLKPPDLFLSITTLSCYHVSLARIFCNTLSVRFLLGDSIKSDITTCLQEAIMNAMLHGNLAIRGEFHTKSGFFAYHTEIEQRLNLPEYREKRIYIRAWHQKNHLQISVSDDGNGFELPDFSSPTNNQFPSGRGLMFIHAMSDTVWLEEDRKTLSMKFDL